MATKDVAFETHTEIKLSGLRMEFQGKPIKPIYILLGRGERIPKHAGGYNDITVTDTEIRCGTKGLFGLRGHPQMVIVYDPKGMQRFETAGDHYKVTKTELQDGKLSLHLEIMRQTSFVPTPAHGAGVLRAANKMEGFVYKMARIDKEIVKLSVGKRDAEAFKRLCERMMAKSREQMAQQAPQTT